MRGIRGFALLALLALVLAGCSSSTSDDTTDPTGTATTGRTTTGGTTSRTTTGGTTGTGTTSGGPGQNHPPIPQLGASTPGGAAPFSVNFTVDAADEDKDALTWALAFGDGSADASGSTLPSTVTHAFAASGNYTVRLTVSDGKASASKELNLTLGGGVGPAQDEAADYTGNPAECFYTVVGDLEGVSHVRFDILPATYDRPFTATWITTTPAAWVEIGFWNDDGLLYRYGGWGNDFPGAPAAEPGQTEQTGNVPATSTYATLRACDGGPGSVAYHAG